MPDSDKALKDITIVAPGVVWMAVHACLNLALKHPAMTAGGSLAGGPMADYATFFTDKLAGALLQTGIYSVEEYAEILRLDAASRTNQV